MKLLQIIDLSIIPQDVLVSLSLADDIRTCVRTLCWCLIGTFGSIESISTRFRIHAESCTFSGFYMAKLLKILLHLLHSLQLMLLDEFAPQVVHFIQIRHELSIFLVADFSGYLFVKRDELFRFWRVLENRLRDNVFGVVERSENREIPTWNSSTTDGTILKGGCYLSWVQHFHLR